jgi:predicted small lipoprotein YifL
LIGVAGKSEFTASAVPVFTRIPYQGGKMQRVVRSTLVGLLTVAGLTACGDKITVPPATTAPLDNTVRQVVVSPASVNLNVGQSVTLAASVDAGAGVTNRTVTWSSSDATVASVSTAGAVNALKAGVATITAASAADPNVKGAAIVTVGSQGGVPQVLVTGLTQGGTNQPINIAAAAGQIDVVLDVQTNGGTLRSVGATMNCPGNTSMTQTQTVAGAAGSDAAESAIPVILSFPTNAFNTTTGVPQLRNGACTITATATTGATGSTPQTATTTTQLTLANVSGVVFNNQFTAVPNAEGVTPTATQANDQFGLPWRTGSVTVTVLPVLYGNTNGTPQTLASVTLTLPGASSTAQVTLPVTTGPISQTWSASLTATSGPRVVGVVLAQGAKEANGVTPLPITPTVIAVDGQGNNFPLITLPGGTNQSFRLDNQAPGAPLVFSTPGRQQGWINAAYTFNNVGTGSGNANVDPVNGTANFGSCIDAPSTAASPYACSGQLGVSASGNAAVTSDAGASSNMTYSFYVIPAASYTAASAANGTSTSPTACSTTGWTKVANGGEVSSSSSASNTAFVARIFETDKLGNARCSDLSIPNTVVGDEINTGSFTNGTFGVDVVAPTAAFEPTTPADKTQIGIPDVIPTITIGVSDDASGISGTPIATVLRRLRFVSGAQANNCVIGSGNACNAVDFASSLLVDNGTNIDGYYTYTGTARDLARNSAPTLSLQVAVDKTAPVMGSIAVPASLTGGASASFATSATDNLDLISWDNTLTYAVSPTGNPAPGANLPIRSARTQIHAPFSGTLITSQTLSIVLPLFIRSVAATAANAPPVGAGADVFPSTIAARAYDAGNNPSPVNTGTGAGFSNIPPASISVTNPLTDWSVAPAGQNAAAVMSTFLVTNVAANISNCPAAGCTGNVPAANPTTVTLTAAATGVKGTNFQFANPFTQVQFYVFDASVNEYVLIGSSSAPVVTDPTTTSRTFTFSLSWDPQPGLGVGAASIIAVGVNSRGDGLATAVNANITLTNP